MEHFVPFPIMPNVYIDGIFFQVFSIKRRRSSKTSGKLWNINLLFIRSSLYVHFLNLKLAIWQLININRQLIINLLLTINLQFATALYVNILIIWLLDILILNAISLTWNNIFHIRLYAICSTEIQKHIDTCIYDTDMSY